MLDFGPVSWKLAGWLLRAEFPTLRAAGEDDFFAKKQYSKLRPRPWATSCSSLVGSRAVSAAVIHQPDSADSFRELESRDRFLNYVHVGPNPKGSVAVAGGEAKNLAVSMG